MQFSEVSLSKNKVFLTLTRFKNSGKIGTQVVVLKKERELCPVKSMRAYMKLRGKEAGPLFIQPVSLILLRKKFDQKLKAVISACGLDPNRFRGHSFRIGGATDAALHGKSDAWIRERGRWSSNAFKKYIRT